MIKLILSFVLILSAGYMHANEENDNEKEKPKQGWDSQGKVTLMFNQSAFNAEWSGGGTTNLTGNSSLSYKFNYLQDRFSWDNRVLLDFGITQNKGEEFPRKTNDRIEYNSILGIKIKDDSKWAYSFVTNFRTQFAKGYTYETFDDGKVVRTERTRFMSPGYLQMGPGFMWKESNDLKVNLAPATGRFTFVDSRFTNNPEHREEDYFGVKQYQNMRIDFGASLTLYAKFMLFTNVEVENILNLYSDYLDEPQNVNLDYTLNIEMKINKTLSANVVFQTIYDNNVVNGFQIREVVGIGLNFAV